MGIKEGNFGGLGAAIAGAVAGEAFLAAAIAAGFTSGSIIIVGGAGASGAVAGKVLEFFWGNDGGGDGPNPDGTSGPVLWA